LLAIIGKQWMTRRNLKRLFNERDWVRRELLGVRARTEPPTFHGPPHILPVLVDADTGMPDEKKLPAELAWFALTKASLLHHRQWNMHFDQLVAEIHGLLGAPRSAPRARGPMPPDLPYLCDRTDQEYALSTLTADIDRTHSLVCILPGHKWEAHAKCLSRLRQLRLLDRMLMAGDGGVCHETLEWNSTLARAKNYLEMLRYGIKTSVLKNSRASTDDVCAIMRHGGAPLVMTLQVTGTDVEECGVDTLRELVDAWKELLAEVGRTPARAVVLWIDLAYDDASQVSRATDGLPLLTPLAPIRTGHIQTWLGRPEVEPYVSGRKAQVLSLADDQQIFIKPGELHMQFFADAVTTLMQG
jgi:hypothetical protein